MNLWFWLNIKMNVAETSTAGFLWVRLKLLQHSQVWWLNDRLLFKVLHLQALFFFHIVGRIKSCPGWFRVCGRTTPVMMKTRLWSLFLVESNANTSQTSLCESEESLCSWMGGVITTWTRCDSSQQTAHFSHPTTGEKENLNSSQV